MDAAISLERKVEQIRERLVNLNERVVSIEAKHPHMIEALDEVKSDLKEIKGTFAKCVWVLVGLFITALFNVIRNGHIIGN